MHSFKLFGRAYRKPEDDTGAASGFDAAAAAASVGQETGGEPSGNPATAEPADVNTDWSALSDDSGDDGAAVEPPAAEPSAPAPAAPTATPQPPAVTPTPAAPADAAAQPAAPVPPSTEPAQPAQPEPTASPAIDPEVARKNYLGSLQQYYALSPENAARLQTEPELVLPELAATLHLEVVDAVMNMLPQHVTSIVEHYTQTTAKNKEAEDAFFKDYPELREHKDAVLRVGQMYRAANPKATKDQAIKAIGDFVLQSLNITRTAPVQQQTQTFQPQTPAAPVNPFIPASGSGASGQPPARPGEWDFVMEPD